jgi:hypothetical protein
MVVPLLITLRLLFICLYELCRITVWVIYDGWLVGRWQDGKRTQVWILGVNGSTELDFGRLLGCVHFIIGVALGYGNTSLCEVLVNESLC